MPDNWRYLFTVNTDGKSYQISACNGRLKIVNVHTGATNFIQNDSPVNDADTRERMRHIIEVATK